MIADLIIYFVIFAGICAAAPLCIVLIYAVLRLIPSTRRTMDSIGRQNQTIAA